ncbi:type I restriction-modification system subunit M N-terminal domain-containing protein [Desulfosporosinus sp.]|uniref:type I restriction-modification system subunit M N-terminal domain-containing protein n=1 Tax=Desulfosporosinus sp. TaxID=157907 RepID=UPI000E8D676B|nr:type I restriction-modification system subunit M N-terminal domain-containing protein [Desulfosporosinus sp.]MBC2722813.1 type I restriction-modification system subunit M N-terminal domain-containing protein [Desulfosporosinus sp.]MBC2724957.1 type I restriction-modification system subunit M N-terminal domain-containing protein [Desulfosporosinus sp.]HBV87798.1 restriction endonuclease subunit M [Desulfosporosinus sp.]
MEDKLSLAEFERFLDETCDSLRGDRDGEEFKEYVIAIVFLKRLNDRFNLEREFRYNKLKAQGLSQPEIEKELEKRESYRLFVPRIARWDVVIHVKQGLADYLSKAFAEIDDKNPSCLGLLNTIDFNKTTETGQKYVTDDDLIELMKRFEKLELSDDHLAF